MFIRGIQYLREFVNDKQRELCTYDGGKKKGEPPTFCDCKYGWSSDGKQHPWSEANGCPEMRNIELLLSLMTEEEYKKIMSRP